MYEQLVADIDTTDIRPVASFLARACRVWGVNDLLKPLRDHDAVRGTPLEIDLKNLSALIRTNAVLLHQLHRCAENTDFAFGYLAVTDRDRVQPQIHNFSNFGRLSFVAMSNFFLESMLRDLVSDFNEEPKFRFQSLSTQVVKLAKLENPHEHVDALNITAKLRNTFHNRGVYSFPDETITVQGITYQFTKDEIVKGCASWDYISHGLACALITVRLLVEKARPRDAT